MLHHWVGIVFYSPYYCWYAWLWRWIRLWHLCPCVNGWYGFSSIKSKSIQTNYNYHYNNWFSKPSYIHYNAWVHRWRSWLPISHLELVELSFWTINWMYLKSSTGPSCTVYWFVWLKIGQLFLYGSDYCKRLIEMHIRTLSLSYEFGKLKYLFHLHFSSWFCSLPCNMLLLQTCFHHDTKFQLLQWYIHNLTVCVSRWCSILTPCWNSFRVTTAAPSVVLVDSRVISSQHLVPIVSRSWMM